MRLFRSAALAALPVALVGISDIGPANAQIKFKSNCPMTGGKSGLVSYHYDIVVSHPRTCFWEALTGTGMAGTASDKPNCGTLTQPGGPQVIGWEYQTRKRGCVDRFSLQVIAPDNAILTLNFTVTVK